jgi:uncharacterized protein YaaR (DUF327 family)
MAKVESPEPYYVNPAVHTEIKAETRKTTDKSRIKRGQKSRFVSVLEEIRESETELGPLRDVPVSDEAVSRLMDDVRSAGDDLRKRPFSDEILHYKRAVRDFMHYVVENGYAVDIQEGLPNYLKPGYRGARGSAESQDRKGYIQVQVVDKKLEDLAALLISGQMNQLELASRLEEIKGLLVNILK